MYSPSRSVRQLDPIADPAWLEFVASCRDATIFHHPAWLKLLQHQYGYEMQACCVEDSNGIQAGLPIARISSPITGRRLVALPFSDACPPLVADGVDAAAVGDLTEALLEQGKEAGVRLTVRSPMPGAAISERYVTHRLALSPDAAEVEANMSKSHGRAIRKATKEGLRGERRTDVEALDVFYRLHLQTRKRLGVPTQPRRFIRRFADLFERNLGFVWLIHEGSRTVAAAVFLTHGETVVYKYGASDLASLKKRPNNLLFLEAIRWSCEAGFSVFDFGRTDLENEGLRKFKRSWGATELDLVYSCLTGEVDEPGSKSTIDKVLSTTIQRSPEFVGRMVGQALYKHYG